MVRGVFDDTERWEMERQKSVEAEAQRLLEAGRGADAVRVVQQFVDANCGRVAKEYGMLNQSLPAMLETVGPRYLFLDYLKEWTSASGVPLPLD